MAMRHNLAARDRYGYLNLEPLHHGLLVAGAASLHPSGTASAKRK